MIKKAKRGKASSSTGVLYNPEGFIKMYDTQLSRSIQGKLDAAVLLTGFAKPKRGSRPAVKQAGK